ncbi:MAG: recombination mediator protein UvsY [Minisyncoccia bacterium]
MTFDELQALAEKDLKLNDTELDLESLKTPALHNKYCKFHNQYINLLKKAEQDRDRTTYAVRLYEVYTKCCRLLRQINSYYI